MGLNTPAAPAAAPSEAAQIAKGWPSEAALLADLKATYPGIHARPLREFRASGWNYGVWSGGEAEMPDGLPIFSSLFHGDEAYDGGVNTAFIAWLEQRGWYVENYDGCAHFILPIAQAKETEEHA